MVQYAIHLLVVQMEHLITPCVLVIIFMVDAEEVPLLMIRFVMQEMMYLSTMGVPQLLTMIRLVVAVGILVRMHAAVQMPAVPR